MTADTALAVLGYVADNWRVLGGFALALVAVHFAHRWVWREL